MGLHLAIQDCRIESELLKCYFPPLLASHAIDSGIDP